MLDLLQQKISLFVLTLVGIVVFSSICLGIEFGVTPAELEFSVPVNKEVCKEVIIFSSGRNLPFNVVDRWNSNMNNAHDVKLFDSTSRRMKIDINYEKNFVLNEKKSIRVCVSAQEKGVYHGLLLFESQNGVLSIGSWISVYADVKKDEASRSVLTGFTSLDSSSSTQENILGKIWPILMFNFILWVILFILLIRVRRIKNIDKNFKNIEL